MLPHETFRLVERYGAQDSVVERLRSELEARGWSQSELSRRLADLRPPYHLSQGAISRMLAHDNPREITVDDLLAFVRVFGIPMEEFVLPTSITYEVGGWGAYMTAVDKLERLREARTEYDAAVAQARELVDEHAGLTPRLRWHRERLLETDPEGETVEVQAVDAVLGTTRAKKAKRT
jgi:transcriptional regulator with XRE-family HTH domain